MASVESAGGSLHFGAGRELSCTSRRDLCLLGYRLGIELTGWPTGTAIYCSLKGGMGWLEQML